MTEVKYVPPCAYQGGKQRLANVILDAIEFMGNKEPYTLYDLCCGSGAVSLEAISRGNKVVMVDKNFYGKFWELIGKGEFDLDVFKEEIEKLPDVQGIQVYLKELSKKPVSNDRAIYHYLLLQAGAFGSKQIWEEDGIWKNNTFRSYWLPTETSNRRSPVNPMMPMPDTLYNRVRNLTDLKDSITGHHIDIFDSVEIISKDNSNKVVYIDPPYKNTTGYKESFDIYKIVEQLRGLADVYVSEGYEMDGATETIILDRGRKKGNISGTTKKKPVIEVLNYYSKWT